MAPPELEMTIMAAEDLKDVATFGKMDVYAVAWIDPFSKQSTRVLQKAGRNPVWNHTMTFSLENTLRHFPLAFLIVQIYSESSVCNKIVGTARLPIQEILSISTPDVEDPALVTLQLIRPSGRVQGILMLSMRVTGDISFGFAGDVNNAVDNADASEPVMGIPVSPYSSSPYYEYGTRTTATGYPPLASSSELHNAGAGPDAVPYAYPPSYAGYYPGQGGRYSTWSPYAYVQPPQPQQSRSNGSLLLGLLGGAIGGLVLGDIFS